MIVILIVPFISCQGYMLSTLPCKTLFSLLFGGVALDGERFADCQDLEQQGETAAAAEHPCGIVRDIGGKRDLRSLLYEHFAHTFGMGAKPQFGPGILTDRFLVPGKGLKPAAIAPGILLNTGL